MRRSEIRGPVVVGAGTVLEEAFVGPYTSIGRACVIKNSALEHCVVLDGVRLEGVTRLEDSVLGSNTVVCNQPKKSRALRLMVGDDAEILL